MECKGFCFNSCSSGFSVLIETLWNVKFFHHYGGKPRHNRINRNIMECKDVINEEQAETVRVLIETLWNVKMATNDFKMMNLTY